MRGGRVLRHASSVLVLEVDGVSDGAAVSGGGEGCFLLACVKSVTVTCESESILGR